MITDDNWLQLMMIDDGWWWWLMIGGGGGRRKEKEEEWWPCMFKNENPHSVGGGNKNTPTWNIKFLCLKFYRPKFASAPMTCGAEAGVIRTQTYWYYCIFLAQEHCGFDVEFYIDFKIEIQTLWNSSSDSRLFFFFFVKLTFEFEIEIVDFH